MKKMFFTSGEFASLCNTTKETLRHYHRIGLLIPEKIQPNGYHAYSDLQVNDFYLIDILKSTGCSLAKICQIFSTPSPTDFQKILAEQLNSRLIDKQNLLRKEKMLRQSIEKYELLQDRSFLGICHVIETEAEEYFIGTPIAFDALSPAAFLKAQKEHIQYCRTHDFGEEYQLSFLMHHESLISRDYYTGNYICSRISEPIPDDRLFIKPQGRYIRLIKAWNPNMEETYDFILDYARDHGHKIRGNAYEAEVSLYMQTNVGNYITEISIEIE
ncbi:MerR family transcriptional regulator [Acetobacterium malicum]|uniref:MerR family transcriptional regulator n=1 Tax=Acetobacterium malicum TaxID=52692 RepID=UPI000419E0D6|nr:MerR family transcriptional regulator [Acetobacterium dehalogenans]